MPADTVMYVQISNCRVNFGRNVLNQVKHVHATRQEHGVEVDARTLFFLYNHEHEDEPKNRGMGVLTVPSTVDELIMTLFQGSRGVSVAVSYRGGKNLEPFE